jgi:hypothetical protein
MRAEFSGFLMYIKKRSIFNSILNRKSKVYAVEFVGRKIAPVTDSTDMRSKIIETTRKSA